MDFFTVLLEFKTCVSKESKVKVSFRELSSCDWNSHGMRLWPSPVSHVYVCDKYAGRYCGEM